MERDAKISKSKAGNDFKSRLSAELTALSKLGVIKTFQPSGDQKKVNIAHKDFPYEEEYSANFLIESHDGKILVIKASTSYRSDRIKSAYWDMKGIKDNSAFSGNIEANVFVVETANEPFRKFQKAVRNGSRYSEATHIFDAEEFFSFLERYYEESLQTKLENERAPTPKESGSKYGKAGNQLERDLVTELNNPSVLEQFRNGETDETNNFHLIVSKICKNNDMRTSDVKSVSAKNIVPPLNSGGPAKTDVIIQIRSFDDEINSTISVKRTTKNLVSCHQYSAEDFIRVLNCQDTKVAYYLQKFQIAGGYDKLESSLIIGEDSVEEFTHMMEPYSRRLTEWALMGKHDAEKLVNPKIQTSEYLFVWQNDTTHFIKFDTYIERLFSIEKLMRYGVPLTWTRSSGKKPDIQLKMPIRF